MNHAFTRHKGVLLCHNANSVVLLVTAVAVPIALLENTNMMPIMTTVNSVVLLVTAIAAPIALLENTSTKSLA